jgi:hypothetical protein
VIQQQADVHRCIVQISERESLDAGLRLKGAVNSFGAVEATA